MKIFSTEVMICATVYIKAESADAAAAILQGVDTGIELSTKGLFLNESLPVSGQSFDDPRLPSISVSPAMTLHLMAFKPGARLTASDFEENY